MESRGASHELPLTPTGRCLGTLSFTVFRSSLQFTLLLVASLLLLAACASTPTRIASEESVSGAIAGARHVAYWLDVDMARIVHPDEVTQQEMDRLLAGAARLSSSAEALEQDLEQATRNRAAGLDSPFHADAERRARHLREQTLQLRTQWEAFTKRRDAEDAAERPTL